MEWLVWAKEKKNKMKTEKKKKENWKRKEYIIIFVYLKIDVNPEYLTRNGMGISIVLRSLGICVVDVVAVDFFFSSYYFWFSICIFRFHLVIVWFNLFLNLSGQFRPNQWDIFHRGWHDNQMKASTIIDLDDRNWKLRSVIHLWFQIEQKKNQKKKTI